MNSRESTHNFFQSLPEGEGLQQNYNLQYVLDLYQQSADPSFAAGLFHVAGEIRNRHLGNNPWWSAGISAVLPCEIEPHCTYCTFLTRAAAKKEEIATAARIIAGLGIRHLHLSGGSRLVDGENPATGYDSQIVGLVEAIQNSVDVAIEVNVGPSLTRAGVRALKQLGVTAITSSLEVLNPDLFSRFKPGDSLAGRIRLMEMCEEEGVPIRSMMLVGLGESDEDRISHLVFLRRFSMLRYLRLSRYMPFPAASAGGVRCSPWPVARLTAIARLMFPTIDLGLAAGNTSDDLALWWLAGGGNQVLGASASMRGKRHHADSESRFIPVSDDVVVFNRMPQISRYLGELGLNPTFSTKFGDQ